MPNFLAAQTRSKVSRTKSDMRAIATGIESYYVDQNAYPWTNLGLYSRLDRLKAITTPVAYLSSLPIDAFNASNDIPINKIYPFWDPPYVWSLGGLNPTDGSGTPNTRFVLVPELYDRVYSRMKTWMLMSYGPDQNFEAAVPPYQVQLYDPTNGTVSNGDIMRWGP
ncbi:MAG: type II secretion system protein GspG [bacterium]|nr:type II secretion system protein GspG [bacterium]